LHILTRRASEGSEALPSLARRVRMSFFGARVIFRGSLPVLEHRAEFFNGLATQGPDRTGFAPIFQRPEDSRQPLQ
jgi:hypothetical protein